MYVHTFGIHDRAATADFWQTRPYTWATATAATMFYFAKSRQDLRLGRLASRGGPGKYFDFFHVAKKFPRCKNWMNLTLMNQSLRKLSESMLLA